MENIHFDVDTDISNIPEDEWKSQVIYLQNTFTEAFLEKYIDKISFPHALMQLQLSEEFLEKYVVYDNMYETLSHQELSESFLEKIIKSKSFKECNQYDESFYWKAICLNQKLSLSFIEKYKGYISMYWINSSRHLTMDIVKKYYPKIDFNEFSFINDYHLLEHSIIVKEFPIDRVFDLFNYNKIDWEFISMFTCLKKEDLKNENVIQYLDFNILKERYPEYF